MSKKDIIILDLGQHVSPRGHEKTRMEESGQVVVARISTGWDQQELESYVTSLFKNILDMEKQPPRLVLFVHLFVQLFRRYLCVNL